MAVIGIRLQLCEDEALVGFQGRGCADGVQPNCCHPFLLEALLFQWPSIRRCASRTMVEHKTPESNKSARAKPTPLLGGLYVARTTGSSHTAGASTDYGRFPSPPAQSAPLRHGPV